MQPLSWFCPALLQVCSYLASNTMLPLVDNSFWQREQAHVCLQAMMHVQVKLKLPSYVDTFANGIYLKGAGSILRAPQFLHIHSWH